MSKSTKGKGPTPKPPKKEWKRTILIFSILVVLLGVGWWCYKESVKDKVDIRIKVISLFSRVLFYVTGAYPGSTGFKRWLWDGVQMYVGEGKRGLLHFEDVTSYDLSIPSTWKRDKLKYGDASYAIPFRVYTPPTYNPDDDSTTYPILLYFHGGGYVVGSIYDIFFDTLFRELSYKMNCIVMAPEYRTAPENKYPAGLRDCYSALNFVFSPSFPDRLSHLNLVKKMDTSKVTIMGDSAGATNSVNVALLARDRHDLPEGKKIAQMVLIYPCTYYPYLTPSLLTHSQNNYLMPKGVAQWFHNQQVDYTTNHWDLVDDDDEDTAINSIPSGGTSPAFLELSIDDILSTLLNDLNSNDAEIKLEEFLDVIRADQTISRKFEGLDKQQLRLHLIDDINDIFDQTFDEEDDEYYPDLLALILNTFYLKNNEFNSGRRSYFSPEESIMAVNQKYLNPWLTSLKGLPAAHLILTEDDPFRDEGIIFAEKLREADVHVDVTMVESYHGFFIMPFGTNDTVYSISQILRLSDAFQSSTTQNK